MTTLDTNVSNYTLSELIAIGVALSINTKNEGIFTLQISNGILLALEELALQKSIT